MNDRGVYVLADGTEIPGSYIGTSRRFVCTPYGWKKLTAWAKENVRFCEYGGRCAHSGSELHHLNPGGRGLGGCWREDRLIVDGRKNLLFVCHYHHQVLESQKKSVNYSALQVQPS